MASVALVMDLVPRRCPSVALVLDLVPRRCPSVALVMDLVPRRRFHIDSISALYKMKLALPSKRCNSRPETKLLMYQNLT